MAHSRDSGEFSIGVLADRTGVTPGVLRTWENRFGFPEGTRTPSGHRRFSAVDVDLVRRVLESRAAGVPLQLAIDAVREQHAQAHRPSVFGELTTGFPGLPARRLNRRTLMAVSHAIEDECLALGDSALVLGAFQEGLRFADAEERWRELARTAIWCAVIADFADSTQTGGGPVRVHLPQDSPMRREWSVVCLSRSFAAVLSAWEVPGAPDGTFEAVISTGRAATLNAARVLCGVVRSTGQPLPAAVEGLLEDARPDSISAAGDTDRLFLRALDYLQRDAPRATS